MEFFSEIVERLPVGLANRGSHLIRDVAGLGVHFVIEHRLQDGVADFLKTLGVGVFAVENLDDMEAVLSFHQIGNGALGQAERGLLKFRDGLALDNPAEISALGLGGVVLGILLGEVLEIRTLLSLLLDVVGLLADFCNFRIGLADGLEQNVFYVSAVFDLVLIDIGVVIGAQGVIANLGGGA